MPELRQPVPPNVRHCPVCGHDAGCPNVRDAARLAAWREGVADHRPHPDEAEDLLWSLTDQGAITAMVRSAAAGDGEGVNAVVLQFGRTNLAAHLLTHCANALHPPVRHDKAEDDRHPTAGTMSLVEFLECELAGHRQDRAHRAAAKRKPKAAVGQFGRVKGQKEGIVAALDRGDRAKAYRFVRDLIRFQIADDQPARLAKSLTDIATEAAHRHMFEMAEDLIGCAQILNPNDVVALSAGAEVLRKTSRPNEALAAYDSTIERFPDNVTARNGRAETLRDLGRSADALAAYDRTIERFPDDVAARNGRAETLRDLGRLADALAAYDRTIERFPDDVHANCGRAETLLEMGRTAEALTAYDATLARQPANGIARNGRAKTLALLGRETEALAFIDVVDPVTRRDWIDFHLATMILLRAGEIDDAIARLRQGAEQAPPYDRSCFINALGYALLRRRRYQEAAKALQLDDVIVPFPVRQTRAALSCHCAAAQDDKVRALESWTAISERAPAQVLQLKDFLAQRFALRPGDQPPGPELAARLDRDIDDVEWRIAAGWR